jgi:hypothetical protein
MSSHSYSRATSEGLVGDVAWPAAALGNGERLHELPAGEVRAPDVPDLARPHEVVERAQRLLDRGARVEPVQLPDVDVVGPEAAEARLACRDEVVARAADVVRAVAGAEARLRREEDATAAPGDGLAEDLLGEPLGVGVGGVEQVRPRLERDVHEPPRLLGLGRAPRAEEGRAAAERGRPQREDGDRQARVPEATVLHVPSVRVARASRAAT